MSEFTHPISFELPEGRKLAEPDDGLPTGVVFNISQFQRATRPRVEAARKHVREILDADLDRSVTPWVDRASGEEVELVKSFFNLADPAGSGVTAFTISDGNLLGLRRAGHEDEVTSVFVGNLSAGRTS